ncbi:hypothetical protein CRG98_030062 [Punica granatum]|uniref:Uncharacterized protein n=1 Tax=Punica granatum TaxID=22663 RepID=A0A2I0IZW9_PUNGR|nr:hypothetical protein CRG98_030062 [Punica granatum]
MARAFNARVRHRDFSPGDLVLRKVLHVTPDSRGKFSYKYDGPFVVKEASLSPVQVRSGTLRDAPRRRIRVCLMRQTVLLGHRKSLGNAPRRLGPSWSHSGPPTSFRSIMVPFSPFRPFGSIPVIEVHPGHIRVHPGHSGPSWSHSGPSWSFKSILVTFGSTPVIQVYPGSCIRVYLDHPGLSWFMHSGPSRSFRSILVHAFGSIPVIQVYPGSCIRVHPGHSGLSWFMHSGRSQSFRSIPVHAFGSIPVIQVYPGSCIRVYPGHIQDYSDSWTSRPIPVLIPRAVSQYIQAGHEQPGGSYNKTVAGTKKGDHQDRGTSFKQPFETRLGFPKYVSVVTNVSRQASGAFPRKTEITTIFEHPTTIPECLETFREH